MLRDSGKPAVGHNCLFDLAFTLEHLAEPLPEQWPAFKHLVKKWFPGLHLQGPHKSTLFYLAKPSLSVL